MNNTNKRFLLVLYLMSALFLTGCGSSITVKKLGDKDTGIPYYLSKPYLLITRGLSATVYKPKITETNTEKPDGTKTTTIVTEQAPVTSNVDTVDYSMQIVYLPDLRDKYGITINPGSGTSETKVTLENGWKLTSLDAITDTKLEETITATAGLVSAITPIFTIQSEADEVAKVPPEYSISIYEMVWDGKVMKFDLENPVFNWP